jgi:hypothetical protein
MKERHRQLLREGLETVRQEVARDSAERAAGARRWEELRADAARPARHEFRQQLHSILSRAVERLEHLRDELDAPTDETSPER